MKRRFHFRLARLLRVRSIAERAARAEWATAAADAHRADEAVDRTRADIETARRELASMQAATLLAPDAILASDRAAAHLRDLLRTRLARADHAHRLAERQREAWSERRRDEHALERLEQRQRELHRTELERVENAENDEWAASRRRERR